MTFALIHDNSLSISVYTKFVIPLLSIGNLPSNPKILNLLLAKKRKRLKEQSDENHSKVVINAQHRIDCIA